MSKIIKLGDYVPESVVANRIERNEYFQTFSPTVRKTAGSSECRFKDGFIALCEAWELWLSTDTITTFWKETLYPYFGGKEEWSETFGFFNGMDKDTGIVGTITFEPCRDNPSVTDGRLTALFEDAIYRCEGPALLMQLFPFMFFLGIGQREFGFKHGYVAEQTNDSVVFVAISEDTKATIVFNVSACRISRTAFIEKYERQVRLGLSPAKDVTEFDDLLNREGQ